MAYLKITLTQDNDYIAIRTNGIFSINFTDNSVFDGSNIKVYKAFTKIYGEIGFEHRAKKLDGAGSHITYTESQDASYSNAINSNWFIFELSNAGGSTNIEVTINIDYTVLETADLGKKNVRTNGLLIETI